MKKILASLLALCLSLGILAGCGSSNKPAQSGGKKAFVFGDTTFNAENEEPTINPHDAYSGWACIRYGVGETLMKIADDGTLEPWLAESAVNVNATTWEIVIKDAVCFSNGKKCDAAAVKACLEHLIEVHERAAGNLKIASMEADGQKLTIVTSEPNPILMNYLSEAYGCIIDMEVGIPDNGCVVGTGPYVATEVVTDDHVNLIKNVNYWDGEVKVDEITVRTISDGDTLAMALQSGEIDAAYGMAYASYPLFENDNYKFTSIQTSRCFWGMMNLHKENSGYTIMSDPAVRKAIAMGINKQDFVDVLLNGYGYTATGAFPDSFAFGQGIQTVSFDPDQAKAELEAAGWVDTDGRRHPRKERRQAHDPLADLPVPSGAAPAGRIRAVHAQGHRHRRADQLHQGSQQHPQGSHGMGHLGQRQRQRRSGRSPEFLRHLLSGQIGQELRRPPQRQAREACRPAAHHLRSGRACEDRRRDAAAAVGRQLLRLLLLPAHEHDHEGQRLRPRSTHLRLL